jgi:uncharacterized protein involved in exopolysaccharide biosynthesis/Mrp family chromosome partitioning ATPase
MAVSAQQRLTPREIARVLFRHRRKMMLFFGGVLVLTLVVIALFPRSYSSEAKLFIQVGRETVALDPTATTGQTMMLEKSQANEINSALEILSSGQVQRRVVEIVGADRILNDRPAGGAPPAAGTESLLARINGARAAIRAWTDPWLKTLRLSDPATDDDLAVRRLDKEIRVWAPKESTIITVAYKAASPQLAHDVVQATTEAFLDQHLRLNRVEGSLEFFSDQAKTLHAKLADAQARLRDRKNEFQMASMEGEREIYVEQIKDVELQILGVERDLAFSQAKVQDLTRAIANLEPEIVTARVAGFANEARDGMREKLYELELQESKLRSSYQDSHPLLIQIRRQRQQAEEILASLPDDRTQTTSALNPNQRMLELQLVEAEAETKALRARQHAADEQLNRLHVQLQRLNDRELQIADLQRDVDISEQKYRMHVEKLEQARVNDELGRGRITNVKLAQPATTMSKPVAPNKRLLMAFGFVVAIGGALGMAFLAEAVDPTLRTSQQVEKELGSRVLLSLPERKRRSRAAARRARGRTDQPARHAGGRRYRELVSEILASHGNRNGNGRPHGKTVGIMACGAPKLRSRVAANLALQAADYGAGRVLLIDADARRRRVARRFQINGSAGWREVVGGLADAESCIHRPECENLAVMPPGAAGPSTLTADSSPTLLGQWEEIKADYGLVVVDVPPSREWDGPPISADWLDEAVLVVEAERTRVEAARRAKESLTRAGIRLAGVVFANRREHIPGWLYRRL